MDEEYAESLLDHLEEPCQHHLWHVMKEYSVDNRLLWIAGSCTG